MGSFDPAEQYDKLGHDLSGRWRFTRSLVESFWGPLDSKDGTPESALAAAEVRLAVELPAAFREGYMLFGAHPRLSGQDFLLQPDDLSLVGPDLLRFRVENQAVAEWACHIGDGDDPQIYLRVTGGEWMPDAGSFSEFFVHMALSEVVLGAAFGDNGGADERRIELLEGFLRRIDITAFLFWPDPTLPPRRFFGGSGVVIADDARMWVWVAALTEEALDGVRDQLPGEWLMRDWGT